MNLIQHIRRLKPFNLPKSEKAIVKIREYTIIDIQYDDNSRSLHRVNMGFTLFELLGLLKHVELDLHDQLSNPEKYITTTRKGEYDKVKFNIKKKDEKSIN